MRWSWLILPIAVAASVALAVPPVQPGVTRVTLPGRSKVTYVYSVVDPGAFRVSVKAFPQATAIPAVRAAVACGGVSMTGGFSRQSAGALRPVGLARTAGQTVGTLSNWPDGGVLSVVDGTVAIVRVAAWRQSPSAAGMALQGRPMLVFDGKVDEPLNDGSRWNRLAVGVMGDGRVVLIGAFAAHDDAVTLRQFATDAIAILGPGLTSLLNMDGGPSAFMMWPDGRLMPAQGAVTTYVCAEAR